MPPKTKADLIKRCGDGQVDISQGGNTGRYFMHWFGSHSWYLLGIADNEHHAEEMQTWLRV